jgi:hypothetical protein
MKSALPKNNSFNTSKAKGKASNQNSDKDDLTI